MLRLILAVAAILIVAASLGSRLSEMFTPGAASAAFQSHINIKGKKQGAFKGNTQGPSQGTSGATTNKPAAASSRRR